MDDTLVNGADLSLAAAASSDAPVDGSDLSLAAASSDGAVEGADLSVAAASSDGRLAVTSAAVPEGEGGAGAGPDFLSDLPDELLVNILLLVSDGDLFTLAARTMVLSRRWSSLWVRLPSLKFICSSADDLTRVHAALAARARACAGLAPPIGSLSISYSGRAAPYPTATWLSLAPPVLSGELHFKDWHRGQAPLGMPGRRGEFELLSFKKTTKICLCLGFLDLALPSSGVFYALRVLSLESVQLSEQLMLTESSFPSLQKLLIAKSHGLVDLEISLKNLIWLNLSQIRGLQLLHVEARRLELLGVISFLRWNLQEANIIVDMLKELRWADPYLPSLVKLSRMAHLEKLSVLYFCPYGRYGGADDMNLDRLRIFKYFPKVHHIELAIIIEHDLTDMHSRMSSLTILPCMENLSLILSVHGHVIGPTVVHLLKMCTQIRKLSLTLTECFEVQNACPLNCICDQPSCWRDQNDLPMKLLSQVEFLNFRGKTHEFDLLKLLFSVAPALRCMKINYHHTYLDSKKIFEDLGPFASQHTSLDVTRSPLHP